MKVFDLFYGCRSYNWAMMRIQEIGNHPHRKEIEKRLKAIWLLDRGRIEELKMVLGVSRSSAFSWRKRLKESGGNVLALAPKSRAPHSKRHREVNPQQMAFIRKYRLQRQGIGKVTVQSELRRYCEERGLKAVSESTVGRIIADLKAAGRLPGLGLRHVVVNGNGRLYCKKGTPRRKKNRRNGYQPQEPGDLVQMDSLHIFQDKIKRYMLTAIDLKGRFGFAYTYDKLNSHNASDFLDKLIEAAPFVIGRIQTDNGNEFENDFSTAIRASPIQHFHTYPRHPQSNGHIERFNRTIRSQFLKHYQGDIESTASFNRDLFDYLLWYNFRKPHQGIGKLSPMEYYLKSARLSRLKSNMLWTLTVTCHALLFRV
jgi:transposase InsO family protein